jgi:carbamoyltransferase
MYILGINISHHASICLLKDGDLIFYLEDDRLSGLKESEFTTKSLISSLTNVILYTKHVDHVIFSTFGKNMNYRNPDDVMIEYIKSRLGDLGITYDQLHFNLEHHLYHAANAFYSSEFEESAALIMDGGGVQYNEYIDLREVESMYYFSNNKCNLIKKHYSKNRIHFNGIAEKHKDNIIFSPSLSCGWIFNTISMSTASEAGKVMGMASYGDSSRVDNGDWFNYDKECDVWVTDNEKILECYLKHSNIGHFNPHTNDYKCKFDYQTAADIAKKVQEETKKHTINLIDQILNLCNTKNIVLSGGYFLNCVNNYEYLEEFPDINFYIDPIAHDGGTAIGAARYLWHCVLGNSQRYPLKTLYLGG